MKKKTVYTKAPKGIEESLKRAKIDHTILPPPDQLIKRDSKVKITIVLNGSSVDFFKKEAIRLNVKYQTMINSVLDIYAKNYLNKR